MKKIFLVLFFFLFAIPAFAGEYVIVRDSDKKVVNAILWDGLALYNVPAGYHLIARKDANKVTLNLGDTVDNSGNKT